jgi:hypothetical protein
MTNAEIAEARGMCRGCCDRVKPRKHGPAFGPRGKGETGAVPGPRTSADDVIQPG